MRYIFALIIAVWLASATHAAARVSVFACEPEWAALVEEIGGDKVKTFSAITARQDAHYIRARPSLIAKIRRADFVICAGADLEIGWLPLLLQRAKRNVQPGTVGLLLAADHVPLLDKPISIDRRYGDQHRKGDPHVHLNPHNITTLAGETARRLAQIDTANAAFYEARHKDFVTRWRAAIARWETEAADLRGTKLVVHHRAFTYLLAWLGIEAVGTLEPKPGVPPTARHLRTLVTQLRTRPAEMIIRGPYNSDDASLWLSERTDLPAIVLPYTIGGDAQSDNLFSLFERTLELIRITR